VKNGHLEAVGVLLDHGADIEQRDWEIGNALTHAALHGYVDMAKLLLDRGANVEAQSTNNLWTALHVGADEGHAEVVHALLEHNANAHHRNAIGETALHRAAAGGHVECVRMLIDAGVDVDLQDTSDGYSALMRASQSGHLEAVRLLLGGGRVDVNKLELEDTGAQVELRRLDGNTALSFSTNRNHTDISKLLLEHGADPNSQNNKGESVLMYAAEAGNAEIVQLLLVRGAIAEQRSHSPRSWTPPMWAAQNGHEEVARTLMIGGARPDARTYEYVTHCAQPASLSLV
jgi:ankyrin repeat protein